MYFFFVFEICGLRQIDITNPDVMGGNADKSSKLEFFLLFLLFYFS